jgi:hypothetical protein
MVYEWRADSVEGNAEALREQKIYHLGKNNGLEKIALRFKLFTQ